MLSCVLFGKLFNCIQSAENIKFQFNKLIDGFSLLCDVVVAIYNPLFSLSITT